MKTEKELMEEVKKELVLYFKREFGDEITSFEETYPNERAVNVAYTETPNERHTIKYEYDLKELKGTQKVNDVAITVDDFMDGKKDRIEGLEAMLESIHYGSFDEYVFVNEDDLYKVLGLSINRRGNYYKKNKKKEEIQ